MIINEFNPEEWESECSVNLCPYHKRFPSDLNYPSCTCSVHYSLVKKRKSSKPKEAAPSLGLGKAT